MSATIEASPSVGTSRTVAVAPRQARPVLFWAGLGAVCLAVGLYAVISWLISGDPARIDTGPTPVPLYMLVSIRAHEAVGLFALAGFAWFTIIRPWIRKRETTWDGMYLIASLLMYPTQDLLMNYTSPTSLYSSIPVNFGSWFCHMPGWTSPNGCKMAEPLLFAWVWYSWGFLGAAMIASRLLRSAKKRWPGIGTMGLVGLCFLGTMVADFFIEVFYVMTGFYTYPGVIKGWTLWYGHYYQFPLYESIFWGAAWAGFILIRFFKDDKGQSFCERGLDRVNVRPGVKPLITMFAILGALNASFFVFYNLPQQWIGTHQSAWPEDTLKRSYLTTGVCGPGSDYACPGPAVPMPRGSSVHLNNEYEPTGSNSPKPPKAVTEPVDYDPGFFGDKKP